MSRLQAAFVFWAASLVWVVWPILAGLSYQSNMPTPIIETCLDLLTYNVIGIQVVSFAIIIGKTIWPEYR